MPRSRVTDQHFGRRGWVDRVLRTYSGPLRSDMRIMCVILEAEEQRGFRGANFLPFVF